MRLLSFAMLMIAVPSIGSAQTLPADAAAFGSRQSVISPALSPSGEKVLYISPGHQSDEVIYVVDLTSDADPQAITSFNEPLARLSRCSWATEDRIVCIISGFNDGNGLLLGYTRLISMKSDGSEVKRLTPRADYRTQGTLQNGGSLLSLEVDGKDNKILMTRDYIKESGRNTRIFNDQEGLGVIAVDVETGRNTPVEKPNRVGIGYIADENGRVRMMVSRENSSSGYDGDTVQYYFRTLTSDKWNKLSAVDISGNVDEGFRPIAVDSGKNIAYGFDNLDGYRALYSVALDGSGQRKLLMARDDVDVAGLIRIGRKNRVVGATYATEKLYVEYFDEALDKIASGLAKALPGKPLVSIVDASEDENELLLIASSDTDPGMVYLLDRSTRSLSELLSLRSPLDGREMGTMEPVSYPAADGTQIPGYLTLPPNSEGKNLPTIVLPHGGPGSRDIWGFDWLPQFLISQGYAVMQPNFRGSAGYGAAWFGKNGFQAWDTAISDVNDAGRWLVSEGIADPDKLAIVGWSYGGYAALQSQVLDPELYKAVAAIAPVTDLELLREENRRFTNFLNYDRFIGRGPHVEAGSPARHADRFKAPVLLVHGTMDQNVGVAHSKLIEDRLKAAEKSVDYLEFKGLDHYLLHSQARGIMLNRLGTFLDDSLSE